MKVDDTGYVADVLEAAQVATAAESLGFDGWWAGETQSDPFVGCALAAERTTTLEVGTSVVVALARNPMTVAVQANDLQLASEGRFSLGLGSQVRRQITDRYSMPWSRPADRMREFVDALHSIWNSWQSEEAVSFEGDFFRHKVSAPMFRPGPNPHGPPPVLLAAVGPLMTRVAGEVADGILCHGFTTERYVREVTIPRLSEGCARRDRTIDDIEIALPVFVVVSDDEAELSTGANSVKNQLAFYGSTPSYRSVLELHGWGDLQPELHSLIAQGRWNDLAAAIDDDMLAAFAVIGTADEVASEIRCRYLDIIDRLMIVSPVGTNRDPETWTRLLDAIRTTTTQDT